MQSCLARLQSHRTKKYQLKILDTKPNLQRDLGRGPSTELTLGSYAVWGRFNAQLYSTRTHRISEKAWGGGVLPSGRFLPCQNALAFIA